MTEVVLDAVGKRCPVPVIELARHIGDVPVGEVVVVLADDPAAAPDIAAWCRMREHELTGTRPAVTGTAYVVRRLH